VCVDNKEDQGEAKHWERKEKKFMALGENV
jgi:hypothetical protein